uniref:Nitronate monooxygenase domain-containing protein n=1 Tax=Alexandrium catenella TaxID=2925 RepID=A0A7S1WGJ3_ALECA
MGHVTGADLAAAVSNAGGIGTIGAIGLSPEGLRAEVKKLKSLLKPGDSIAGTLPFGVDLLLPKVGGNARKTNADYTGGKLGEHVEVMIEECVPLFVCAVGIPDKWIVDKMHAAGMVVMNMAGHPKHVTKALDVGVDIICATGTEGGAHTGDISTLVLLPQCADLVAKRGAILVGGGGVFDGRGVAACMALGASGVWMGTRFLATPESNTTDGNKKDVLRADSGDTRRIEIYSGRPLRVIKNPLNEHWAHNEAQLRELLAKGVVPIGYMHEKGEWAPGKPVPRNLFGGPAAKKGGFWNDVREKFKDWRDIDLTQAGQCVGGIHEVKPAAAIVEDVMAGLIASLQKMGQIGGQVPSRL